MDPFEQLQLWLEQHSAHPVEGLSERLAKWSEQLERAARHSVAANPDYHDLIQQVRAQSEGLTEIYQALLNGDPAPEVQLNTLRATLHRVHVNHLLRSAEVPEQYLPLVFTQLQLTELSQASRALLTERTDALDWPVLRPLKQLLDSMLAAQKALSVMLEHLAQVTEVAISDWLEQVNPQAAAQPLDLWVQIYDRHFQQAYRSEPMQQRQGDLINAISQVKSDWYALVDRFYQPLGLPTRHQIEQLVSNLDQQRRRIRALERELAELKQSIHNPVPATRD